MKVLSTKMTESSKVRLVRCPKCQNLLPELPDYSVYQCGGCGAVLRAKKCDAEGEKVSERSNEETVTMVPEKSDNFAGKETGYGVENGEDRVSDSDGSSGIITERYGIDSKGITEKGSVGNGSIGKNEMGNGDLECEVDELKTQAENANGLKSSGRIFRRRLGEREEAGCFGRIRRGDFVVGRFPTSGYAGEGTSRPRWDCDYSSVFTSKDQSETSRPNGVELVEANREELLRKLDELKDQLSRCCDVKEKTAERIPLDQRAVHPEPYADSDEWLHNLSSGFSRGSRQFYAPNKRAIRPHYFDHHHEPISVMNRSEMTTHNYHPSMPNSNLNLQCEDPVGHHTLRRPPHRMAAKHRHQTSHPYLSSSSHYIGGEPDPFEPHPCNLILNQPPCSCYHCHETNQQVPVHIPTSNFCSRRLPHLANKLIPCHHEIHGTFGPQGYNSRICNAHPVVSCDPQSHKRWLSDLNLELGGFTRSHPQRVMLANDGHHCHPVAGGAPFIACHNCFELLKFPKKLFQLEKSQWRISCGACCSVISLAIVDEKLVCVSTPTKQTSPGALDRSNEVVYQKPCQSRGPTKLDSSLNSEDYDDLGYDFQSMDKEQDSSDTCQGLNSSKSDELQNVCSLSPSTSEDVECPDDCVPRHGVNNAPEMPVRNAFSPPPPGSPLEDHFDYSSKYSAVDRCGKGNLSSRSDQERVITNKSSLRQNSLKESLLTEMEMSPSDYANTGATQDTADASREEDQLRGKRGVDSFLAGLIKKRFWDFSRSMQVVENGKRNVIVNGHVIPDRLVKKAEKLAGPIYPGQYWYDFRAGFWGAMGGPCLGIIPPVIEEFNYPMLENCAAGDTGVFVNGRELHQKDLDLLASRGLPVTREGSYLIDISGRVLDEDSGEELDSLGKLAPTVEKVKHGFGMRAPKAAK